MASSVSESSVRFALHFFQKLSKNKPCENLLFSPISVGAALSLFLYGASGGTAAELEKVLHWDTDEVPETPRHHLEASPSCEQGESREKRHSQSPHSDRKLALCSEMSSSPCPQQNVPEYECEMSEGNHAKVHKILASLNKASTNYELSFANQLYGDESIAFNQKFLFCALKLYLTQVSNVDFHNTPEDVRKIINLWVHVRTHGKIKNLLHKHSITSLTQLLYVNALHFKGQWDMQFDKELTKESPFHVNEMTYNTVKLMWRKGLYKTSTIKQCDMQVQVLEIPYKDNELSMFILLPDDCSSEALQQLEEGLTYEKLAQWICQTQLKLEEVEVAIPKMKIEKNILTSRFLEALNVTQVLDPKMAELLGITRTEDVALSKMVHSASLEVNEEGGKAPIGMKDQRQKGGACVQFVADHPFLFFVLHNCTGSILLLGRFIKPEKMCGCH